MYYLVLDNAKLNNGMEKLSGFKNYFYLEDQMSSDRDTAMGNSSGGNDNSDKADYFSTLGDEQGIQWKDLVTTLESEPWVSAHFGLGKMDGKTMYKLAAWEIVKGSLTPNGADIRLKPQHGDRSYLPGHRLNKSSYKDDKRYHLNRQELIKFLTSGWSPAVQNQDPMGGMTDPSMMGTDPNMAPPQGM